MHVERDTREQVIHLLTEAAEIEHNLLCSYLYAVFSLKGPDDGLSRDELQAVTGWREAVMSVTAGLTFAVPRHLRSRPPRWAAAVIVERLHELVDGWHAVMGEFPGGSAEPIFAELRALPR